MLPGKRSDTKLNLLIEESRAEKLSRSKIFLWFLANSRLAASLLAALIALFLIAAFWYTKKDVHFQEQYIKVQSNVQKMEENLIQGNDQQALEIWTETSPLIQGHTSFIQAFEAKTAELLLLMGAQEEAIPLMQNTIARTKSALNPKILSFIAITEKIAKNDLSQALSDAKQLAIEKESELPMMLRAYNLLQIPALAKAVNEPKEELESIERVLALIESRSELGSALYLLSQTMQSDTITYLDYMKERKNILTSIPK